MRFAPDARVFVALGALDLRWGFDKLAALVVAHFGRDPRHGAFYVFLNRARTTVKVAFADGSGVCLFWKKLDRGTFALPEAPSGGAAHVEVDEATLEALLDGLPIAPAAPAARPLRRLH